MEVDLPSVYGLSTALLIGTALILVIYFIFKARDDRTLPPGPRGFQAFLDVFQAMRQGTIYYVAQTWSKKYGDIVVCRSLFGDIVVVNTAKFVRQLFGGKEFEPFTSDRPDSFIGWFGFFNYCDVASGSTRIRDNWPKVRRAFHQALQFYGGGVDHMESAVQAELRRLVTELEASKGQDVNVDIMVPNSVICVLLTMLSGERPEQVLLYYARSVNERTNQMFNPITNLLLTSMPWLRFVPFLHYRKMCQDFIRSRDSFLKETFTKAKTSHIPNQPRGVIDVLLDEKNKEDNDWLSEDNIKAIIMNILAGGHVTSTATLKLFFLYMMHNPEVMLKVQKELDDNIGQRTPSLQDRSKLSYTEAVINEILRIVPPVPLFMTHMINENVDFEGYKLPKGAQLFANSPWFQNDPAVFTNPSKFSPDRLLDQTGRLLPANHPLRKNIIPFGIGKRICPGESFARSRIFLYVAIILQKFDILPPTKHKLPPADGSVVKRAGITIDLEPFYVSFRVRSTI